ncbi:MAG: Ig-like domain-containing protein [Anaerolineae bacterium]|nr:Ig-like domain-containing protein [Gemmatimonadaceae bacterium]
MNKIGVISISLVVAACGGSDDGGTTPGERAASVTISPATVATFASLGQTAGLTGQVRGDGGSVLNNVTISWTTLSASVASVSAATGSGTTVTSVGNGNTKIIATVATPSGARSDTVDVAVQQAFAAVLITPATVNLQANGTQQLTASLVDARNTALALPGVPAAAFSTSNSAVADVSATGLVTAKTNGNAVITASATFQGITHTATRSVVVATSVGQLHEVTTTAASFSPASLTIRAGDRVRFTIAAAPHNVLFDSNPPVEGDIGGAGGVPPGTVETRTFNAAGATNYHCSIHNGMTGSITVNP